MSHHIGDTNEMSDTPRTDEAQFGTGRVSVSFARQLERELNESNQRIKRLEDRIDRASKAFFADCPDEDALSKMLAILEEERGNVSKETIQSDSSIWAKAGIGFTTEDKP